MLHFYYVEGGALWLVVINNVLKQYDDDSKISRFNNHRLSLSIYICISLLAYDANALAIEMYTQQWYGCKYNITFQCMIKTFDLGHKPK